MDRRLLRRFLEAYPYQPATAVWRASEVAALASVTFPHGLGLDLGCGDGRLTRIVSDEAGGLRLVGLDIDPKETALARAEGFYERVHTSSAETIPEASGSFDFVVSISVMEHIPQLEPVLREVARVLKPRGQLIATVPGVGFHRALRGPLLPGQPRDEYLRTLDQRVAHVRYWTIAEWQRALKDAGLAFVAARPIQSRSEVRRWETISRVTAGVLHTVSRGSAPIEIQRSLGLRRAGQKLPAPVASTLASLLALGVDSTPPTDERDSGCLLVTATRPGTDS